MARKPKEPISYPGVREKDGRFTYRYSVPAPGTKSGRKQKETPSFSTAKEAFEQGIKIKAKILDGTYFEEGDMKFLDFKEKFLEMYAATGVKEITVNIRRNSLKKVARFFDHKKMVKIGKYDYKTALDTLKAEGYSKNSLEMVHAACSMLFKSALELGKIEVNPVVGVLFPVYTVTVEDLENNVEIPNYMEKEELALFLKTVKQFGDRQDFNIFFTLGYTGMRIGELQALKPKDHVRLEKYISITKTIVLKGKASEFKLNTPKTKASRREIDISDSVVAVLDDQKAYVNEFKMANRKTYFDAGFLFINNQKLPGYPMGQQKLGKRMKEYLRIAGLSESYTMHSLRHTHVSLLAEAGIDLEVIMRRMGHSNDEVTRRIYLHVTKTRRKEAPEKFELMMNGL